MELLACSKSDLLHRCAANGLDPKGNKNVFLMRLIDNYALGAGRTSDGKGGARRSASRNPLLELGAECLGLVFRSVVKEEVDDDVGPVCDWRRDVVSLGRLAKVCTMFRDAARLLVDPILSRGSIRDWPARNQLALIKMMCAKRQVLCELSLTLVDEVELPLLLLLVLKCDVSSLTSLKLISDMGEPELFWQRIMKGKRLYTIDHWAHDIRTKNSYSVFSKMASSLGVSLPNPGFFRDSYLIGGQNWGAPGRLSIKGHFPRQFLTMSLSYCPALTNLDITNFRLDAFFFRFAWLPPSENPQSQ